MDSQTVAAVAGVQPGTLSTWIYRDLVPGVTPGARGKTRDFTLEQAVHIGIMTELVRLRLAAPQASAFVAMGRGSKRLLLVSAFTLPGGALVQLHTSPGAIGFDDESELPGVFADLGFRAPSYSVVDIELITANMERAEREWLARQEADRQLQENVPRRRGRPRKTNPDTGGSDAA